MKISVFFIATLLFAGVKVIAQESAHTTKVRIKKMEVVNGTTSTIDTVFTIDGPLKIHELPGIPNIRVRELPDNKKIVIVTDEIHGDKGLQETTLTEEMDEQVRQALNEAGVDGKNLGVQRVVIVDNKSDGSSEIKRETKVVVIKTIRLSDPDKTESKMLEKTTGINDGRLTIQEMQFYPNPNNGKFNLSFTLNEKGDTRIQVLNNEGKAVFTEQLYEFTGAYDKQLDISEFPSGVYFVRVEQNDHAQVKKIILE